MFVRFVKYGKTIRRTDGTTVHAEVSLDLSTADYEEEAWAQAKRMVNRELAPEPLKATIGEMLCPRPKPISSEHATAADPGTQPRATAQPAAEGLG